MEMTFKSTIIKIELLNNSFKYKGTIKATKTELLLVTISIWDESNNIIGTYQYNNSDDSVRWTVKPNVEITGNEICDFMSNAIIDIKSQLNLS